jgi:hypothetical protein
MNAIRNLYKPRGSGGLMIARVGLMNNLGSTLVTRNIEERMP